jgi:hypothetical protein
VDVKFHEVLGCPVSLRSVYWLLVASCTTSSQLLFVQVAPTELFLFAHVKLLYFVPWSFSPAKFLLSFGFVSL